MRKLRTLQEFLKEELSDHVEVVGYLDVALEGYQEDGDTPFFLKGVNNAIVAQGGISELAKRTHMSPDALMKILSSDKAPHIDTLGTILKALGCRLSITPIASESPSLESEAEDQRTSAAG